MDPYFHTRGHIYMNYQHEPNATMRTRKTKFKHSFIYKRFN